MKILKILLFTFVIIHAQIQIDPNIKKQLENIDSFFIDNFSPNYHIYIFKGNQNLYVKETLNEIFFDNYTQVFISTKKQTFDITEEKTFRQFISKEYLSLFPKSVIDSSGITYIAYEYEQKNNLTPEMIGAMAFIHRKIENKPVRGGAFISMDFDSNGILQSLEYRWPQYTTLEKSASFNKEFFFKRFYEQIEFFEANLKDISSEAIIKNIFASWKKVISNENEEILVPCISFIGFLHNSDKNKHFIIDVPIEDDIDYTKLDIVQSK